MKTNMRAAMLLVSMLAGIRGVEAQGNRQVLVAVVDGAGAPVTDLQPGDFEVRENTVPRKIVRARRANDPMRIALTVDSSTAVEQVTNQLRAGLQQFFAALPESTEVSLMSTGGQARLRFAATSDRKKLSKEANGFFVDGGGNAALDGVMQGYEQFLKKAEARSTVLVLVTGDGPMGGTVRQDQFERFLTELRAHAVTGHAVVLSNYRGRSGSIATFIALGLAESTGGSYESIAAATALPDKMKALGEKLAEQAKHSSTLYRLEYATDTKGPASVEVGVLRQGTRVTIVGPGQLK